MTIEFTRDVYIDTEMNRLILPTKIWCIVCVDLDTKEVFKFTPNSPMSGQDDFKDEFKAFAKTVRKWVGHNIIGYDSPNVNRILGEELIPWQACEDTLVMSRLFRPTAPFREVPKVYNRQWGHSLEAWGRYFNFPKGDWSDFSKFSEGQLEYCVRDTTLGIMIYESLLKEKINFSQQSIDLEHCVAFMLHKQTHNGFYLDQEKAKKLRDTTQQLLEDMNGKLQTLFPPEYKYLQTYIPKFNKDGSLSKVSDRIIKKYTETEGYKAELKPDGSYDLFMKEAFNPNSGPQVAKRLLGIGWVPVAYTEKGNIKTDKETMEEALSGLLEANPDKPELRFLADYGIVSNRNEKASKWLELASIPDWGDGRVHGSVIGVGASTHRMAHFADNMANIASVDMEKVNGKEVPKLGLKGGFGWESRDCWSVPSDRHCLVGADASGIQLRALAHYMNDPEYIRVLLTGDIHEVNRVAAGIKIRHTAKTFIYAWLLGAGDEKIGLIVGVTEDEYEDLFKYAEKKRVWDQTLKEYQIDKVRSSGRKATRKLIATIIKGYKTKEQFLDRTPALKHFRKKVVPAAAKQGYVVGLDGRKIWVPNEHLTMGAFLQGFEAVVMKLAMKLWHEELDQKKIPFKLVATVHDEFQVETFWEYGEQVGEAIARSIKKAGEILGSNCPLDGGYKIGRTWAETH